MRAVVVSAWEPWRLSDGAVWILHHHLRRLASRHDISVLTAGAPAAESPVPEGVRTLPDGVPVRWFGASSAPGVDYAQRHWKALRSREPAHVGYVERPGLLAVLADELSRGDVDVVHAFGWGTAALWRHTAGVPVVHVAVDAWHRNHANRMLPWWRRAADAGELRRIRRHEQRHYPHDAAVVVVADRDAEALRALVPAARIEVVPNGVDAGCEPAPVPATSVIGFHGSFDAQHNVDAARVLVRQVLPRVRREIPDASVLLVGRRPGSAVKALVGDRVELRGDVADVRAELSQIAVYAAPLVSGWGMKNKVLEAMAAGRPVVTTREGSTGIGAGAGLVEVATPEAVADAVVALLRDRARLQDEGAAARRRVEREFTWDAGADRIEALWQDVTA